MLTPESLPQYDIIVETLTGAELKVTVTEKDTIGYIKSRIQKYEGIPIGHQHLLYNHSELNDATEMKDVPLVKGSRLKLVLGLKGGPVSARRVVTLPDYENWFDLSDVLNTSRQEPLTISTPGVKVLVYKDCKKNIHRLMKFRTGKNLLTKGSEEHTENPTTNESQNDQWLNDNINTLEKMHQLRTKLEWKKRNKNTKPSTSHHAKESETRGMNSQVKCNIESEMGRKLRRLGFMSKSRSAACDMSTALENPLKADSVAISRIAGKVDGDIKNWCQTNEKINNNSLFFSHHRHSQPSLKVAHPLVNCVNYFGSVNGRSKSAKPPNAGEYSKMKLRENIRRNRSFKTINTENDMIIDENQVLGGHIDGGATRVASSPSIEDCIFRPSSSRMTHDEKVSSTSVQDLIEQFSKSRLTSLSDPYGDSLATRCEKEKMLSKRSVLPKHIPTASFENKLFVERQHTFAINNRGESRASCGDFQLDTTNTDTGYRVFKLPSENGSSYELPKLLIREDSPVESFHSSDSQLETLALRGESPKTVMDTFAKIDSDTASGGDQKVSSAESILQLYDSPSSTKASREKLFNILDNTSASSSAGGATINTTTAATSTKTLNSNVEMTNLELSFLNEEHQDVASQLKYPKEDVLKISNEIEWKSESLVDFEKQSPPSSTSFNFMSSGDISPTEDDDDVFNSCEMLHHAPGGKSKSVEMNEFRMMFGSSPTLLNNYSNNGGVPSSGINSRLNGASATSSSSAFMYRRHPDACLSSSTSNLECLPGRAKGDNVAGNVKSTRELPSLLRHRNNEHLDYMRSYENLDRTKIVRLRNERVSTVNGNGGGERDWRICGGGENNLSAEHHNHHHHLPRQESTEDFSAFTRINYHHDHHIGGSGGDFPVSFPSNESLFNINFDTFEDDVIEIDTLGMFDGAHSSGLILPEIHDSHVKFATTSSSSTSTSSVAMCHTTDTLDGATGEDGGGGGGVAKGKNSKKLRCAECKKKLGLIMVMRCHCEKVFCPQHRYAEAHNCSYNFKQEGRKILTRENPLVVAQKLPKI